MSPQTLAPEQWQRRHRDHQDRVAATLHDHQDRSGRGVAHPVEDFLFEYYRTRAGHLARWSPGHGVLLAGEVSMLSHLPLRPTSDGSVVDVGTLAARQEGLAWIHRLLERTAPRPPSFGCFGLHEWAMVHRTDRLRHPQLGLRLSDDQVAEIVEERGIRCTHVDAFRFFTPTARGLNQRPLTRATQADDDQPGCLHVTMDLYKWATTLGPLAPSELVMDCFDLALDVRWIDMRASPYDLGPLPDPDTSTRTTQPIMIETARGRSQYVEYQRWFSERAVPLRSALTELYGSVLAELNLRAQ